MKKIFVIGVLLLSLALTSCKKNKVDDTKRVDVPSQELVEDLKLDSVKNGKSIKEVDTTKAEYYNIKIANEPNSTLFTYNSMLDSILEEHGTKIQNITVRPLMFTAEITTDETTGIIREVFDETTGITKETLGLSFELSKINAWTTSIDMTGVIEAYQNNQRNNSLSVIYLPTFVEHVSDNKTVFEAYVFIPVYYELTTVENNIVSSEKFSNLPVKTFTFNANHLLPSNQ